jgi:hypothetical protein
MCKSDRVPLCIQYYSCLTTPVLFAASILFNGCGGGTPAPTITSVAVSCASSSVLTGQTTSCSAALTGTGSYSSTVSWAVSPASMGTVNGSGVFTPSSVGTATITATSTQDSTKSGSKDIAVGSITSITVTCSPTTILTIQTAQCAASVVGAGTYSNSVSWSATGGTITSAGVFTPSTTGTARITATSTQDSTKSGSTDVGVGTITGIAVTCSPKSILTTQTSQCTASVTGTGTYSNLVTWSATDGTITSSGLFSPSSAGTASITATSVKDPTQSGSAPKPLPLG